MAAPANPNIYHIVHLDRLSSILSDGKLFSDEGMSRRVGDLGTTIGMNRIKEARLHRQVGSLSKGTVGQYVPFYFCPRSVMLYLIYVRSKELTYRGGQQSIIHLVADSSSAISWADENERMWAFTNANARSVYAEFYFTNEDLNKLRWDLIPLEDWKPQDVKEAKQSEFLLKDSFPWMLIREIGVYDEQTKRSVESLLISVRHKPLVTVRREWYY